LLYQGYGFKLKIRQQPGDKMAKESIVRKAVSEPEPQEDSGDPSFVIAYAAAALGGCMVGIFIGWLMWG
jgi:hypothetical protein